MADRHLAYFFSFYFNEKNMSPYWYTSCTDQSERFVRGGPILTTVFFKFRGKRIKIPLNASHHRPASETPFEWRFAVVWLAGTTLYSGLVDLLSSMRSRPVLIFQGDARTHNLNGSTFYQEIILWFCVNDVLVLTWYVFIRSNF